MTNILHIGLGALGKKVVRFAIERGFNVVGAVDTAPDIVGQDLGEVCGISHLGIKVSKDINEARKGKNAKVALVTTISSLEKLESQIEELLKANLNIVSTCEELSFPWNKYPMIARRIDDLCKKKGLVCIGTGVNPGYLMDLLPTVLSGICQEVHAIKVWRIQDASNRRTPFQAKIGSALTLEQFKRKQAEGTLGHVGLQESLGMIAYRLGWKLNRTTASLNPILAEKDIKSTPISIPKGMVRGVEQIARGFIEDRETITLIFRAAIGEPESYDRIKIEGIPKIDTKIEGGVNGDIATCAIVLNTIRSVLDSTPGLKTMCDITPVAYFK